MQSFSVYFTASNLKFYTLARAMKSNTILDPLPILHFIKNERTSRSNITNAEEVDIA